MKTPTANDALPIVRARALQETGSRFPGAASLHAAAVALWDDEWNAYQTLVSLPGLRSAAECAYQRRTAASALTKILVTAL